ncbi:MAG: hypothetical protein ACLPN1_06835 [Dissulfurispiraceae bacterium]
MTKVVTCIEDVGTTAVGLINSLLMAMSRHRSSMHRLHSRASVSFYQFAKGIASRRMPSVQAKLIWVAVAGNLIRYERTAR